MRKPQNVLGIEAKALKGNESSRSAGVLLTRKVQRRLRAKGLSGAKLHALVRLFQMLPKKGLVQVTGTYLADSLGISSQMANRYLREFEALGLIKRLKSFVMQSLTTAIRGIKSKITRRKKQAKSLFLRKIKRALKPRVSQGCSLNKKIGERYDAKHETRLSYAEKQMIAMGLDPSELSKPLGLGVV